MSLARPSALGNTRNCPHCKCTVLASASICPACNHHLRFNLPTAAAAPSGYAALQIEGTVQHKQPDEPCEFCVVLSIADENGKPISRQVVGVGVLQPEEMRRFSVSVNLLPARATQLKAPTG